MSKQQVVEFFQAAAEDELLTAKVKSAAKPATMMAIANEYGYTFTEDELLQFDLERRQSDIEELSDQQMEAVAGGGLIVFGLCLDTHRTHIGTRDPGRCC